MNFATDTLKKSGLTAVDLERRTGIPREYFRRLRREQHVRRTNLNTKKGILDNTRVFATNDTRWQQVAMILLPESPANQQRFLDAVAMLQGRRSPEDASEEFGERKAMILTGRVEAVLVCESGVRSERRTKILLFDDGVRGDRHAGRQRQINVRDKTLLAFGIMKDTPCAATRQVTAVSTEELAVIAQTLGIGNEIEPGLLGENLVISGIPRFTELPPGTFLCFKAPDGTVRAAVLAVWGENTPCTVVGAEVQEYFSDCHNITGRFVKAAAGKRGLTLFVMCGGAIKEGDTVVALIPEHRLYEP